MLLQLAIRQSLASSDTPGQDQTADQVDIWEALEGLPPGHSRAALQGEDRLLQQAIEVTRCYKLHAFDIAREIFFACIFMRPNCTSCTLYCRPA